jgi:hypothetical protein
MEAEMARTDVLQVRPYASKAGDFQTVSGWGKARGNKGVFAETLLPPLGLIVELNDEPVAALWCYESYGIGVAFLEWACTKPGIGPVLATRALSMAEETIADILKRRGNHGLLIAHTIRSIARVLERYGGYKRASEGMITMMRRVD